LSVLSFDCRLQRAEGFRLDLRFEMGAGITGLIGPSGSGKTTTLHLVAGLLRPDRGVIRTGDCVLVDTAAGIELPPERRQIGYVFQDFALFPHRTVLGNLMYGMRRRAGGPSLDQVVEVLELADLLPRFPRTLSGGQQQRTAIARAILSGPKLLLMDEPLSAQHAELRAKIGQYIRRIVAEFHLPILLVSHDTQLLETLHCQVLRIDTGRLAAEAAATRLDGDTR
jgi:molybdate transport system ATP-binding protein